MASGLALCPSFGSSRVSVFLLLFLAPHFGSDLLRTFVLVVVLVLVMVRTPGSGVGSGSHVGAGGGSGLLSLLFLHRRRALA